MTTAYVRRPAPTPTFTPDQKAWLDLETSHIADGIGGSSSAQQVVLSSDVTNASNTTNKATGLKLDVVSGTTYTFRFFTWLDAGANTGGVSVGITHPAYTSAKTHYRGTTTGTSVLAEDITTSTANPVVAPVFVSYAGIGFAALQHTFTPSASGTVELVFKPSTNGQTYTMKAGSYLEVFTA